MQEACDARAIEIFPELSVMVAMHMLFTKKKTHPKNLVSENNDYLTTMIRIEQSMLAVNLGPLE